MKSKNNIILGMILILPLMMLSMAGCGSEQKDPEQKNSAKAVQTEVTTPETPVDELGWPSENCEKGFIDVDGGQVDYYVYGKDKPGTAVIVLHGGPGSISSDLWKQFAIGENRPVVFFDQLGTEGTLVNEDIKDFDDFKKYCTIESFVEQVDAVVGYFDFDDFVLLGHSWGTMLAVEYTAAKQPDNLKGLILAGPFLRVDTWVADAERLIKTLPDGDKMWAKIQECESTGEYDKEYDKINEIYSENFYSRTPGAFDGTPGWAETSVISGEDVYYYMWGPTEFSCTGTLKGHDSTPLLKDIDIPVLYLCGEYDSGTPEAAKEYEALTPNGEVCVLPGCGHDAPRERPLEFNAAVDAFAARAGK